MATTGPLDSIVTRIESYMGEFLMSRQQLIDAGAKIDQALAYAQGSSGTAKIGTKVFTLAELQQLSARNTQLLNENADLQARINSFKDAYNNLASGAESVADALIGPVDETGEIPPWFDTPGLLGSSGGLGVLPGVVVPGAYLVGVGAVLAGAVYLFISNLRSHLGRVAGEVGSNLIIYGGIALLAVWYAKKQRWI